MTADIATTSAIITSGELLAWAKAFAFTEIIETPIYRYALPTRWHWGLAASALTHPFVWFFFPWLSDVLNVDFLWTAIASEIFAFAGEMIFFRLVSKRAISWRRAALVSLIANGSSLGLGLFARAMWGII